MSDLEQFHPDARWFETYRQIDAEDARRDARLARVLGAVLLVLVLAAGGVAAVQRLGIRQVDPAVSAAFVD